MKKFNFDISLRSYSPYSEKTEHCLILGDSGKIYPGVRVENISFPLTIPAVQAGVCSCLGNNDTPVGIIETNFQDSMSDFWIQTFHLNKMNEIPEDSTIFDPLIDEVVDIFDCLKELCKTSVSDQSEFPVAALLKTENGFIPGVNIEFEEWNLGLCAERVALSRAIASGYKEFQGMHIYAPKSDYISPCGACRQVLFEFMPDQEVELHHDDESTSRHFVYHLLPNGFTTNSLKK